MFHIFVYLFLKILFTYRERGREGERDGEKHQCVVASHVPSTGDLAPNPGMCPNWELNQRPFGSQALTQSTELFHPSQGSSFIYLKRTMYKTSNILFPNTCSFIKTIIFYSMEFHFYP